MKNIKNNLKIDDEKKKNEIINQKKKFDLNEKIKIMSEKNKKKLGLPTAQELETAFHAVKPFVTQNTDVSWNIY